MCSSCSHRFNRCGCFDKQDHCVKWIKDEFFIISNDHFFRRPESVGGFAPPVVKAAPSPLRSDPQGVTGWFCFLTTKKTEQSLDHSVF
jgi:hypothetical protein